MSFLPIIERELRVAARQPSQYGWRTAGVTAALLAFLMASCRHAPGPRGFPLGLDPYSQFGAALFGYLNALLFFLIWAIGPLMTADCLSRERREGTLGLLFLTPLSSPAVVLGKSLAHGLRAWLIFLAAAPVFALPLFLGGLGGQDLALAFLLDSSALALALAAGLLASAWTRERTAAIILAETLGGMMALGFVWTHGRIFCALAGTPTALGMSTGLGRLLAELDMTQPGVLSQASALFAFATDFGLQASTARMATSYEGRWTQVWLNAPAVMQQAWFLRVGLLAGGAWLGLGLAVVVAAWRVRVSWHEAPPPAWWQRWRARLLSPLRWRSALQPRRARLRARNPVVWLCRYSVPERLTRWGWCVGVLLAETLLASDLNDLGHGQRWVGLALLLGLALNAAASFARERDTGALELLLVTPVRPGHLINARAVAVWRQFLPALLVLGMVCLWWRRYPASWGNRAAENLWPFTLVWPSLQGVSAGLDAAAVYWLGSAWILPVLGLYFAMRHRTLWRAWLATCATGLILPPLLCGLLQRMLSPMDFLFVVTFAFVTVWYAFRPPRRQIHFVLWPLFLCLLAGLPWVLFKFVLPMTAQVTGLPAGVIKLFLVQLACGGAVWRLLHHNLTTRRFALARPEKE